MENAGFFSSSLLVCGRERKIMYVQVQACVQAWGHPQLSFLKTLCFWGRVSHGPAASLVSLLAGSELQGSTWLFLQKTGVTNRHHHSQIVQHGFWDPVQIKWVLFQPDFSPASCLCICICVFTEVCTHLGEQFCRARQGLWPCRPSCCWNVGGSVSL